MEPDIYKMELFDSVCAEASNGLGIEILRVPGGWLIAWGNYQPQFVEFHKGFQTLAALEGK